MDETNTDIDVDTMECQLKKRSSKDLVNDDDHKRVVSGTCNVCATPCSSCMHLGMKSAMDSKVEGAFSENNLKKETDKFSCVNCEGEPICKSRLCDNGEHVASEGSNFSVISNRDSLSENAESKTTIKIPDAYDASEDVDVPSKVFLVHETVSADGIKIKTEDPHSVNTQSLPSSVSKNNLDFHFHSQSISIQDEQKHGQGCHGDNISFISKLKGENAGTDIDCHNSDSDMKRMQCSSVLTGDLPSKSPKMTQIQTSLGVNAETENSYRSSGEPNNESLKYSSGYNSENDGASKQPHQSDCLLMDNNPQIRNSSCGGSGSEKIEENPNFQLQGEHHDISLKKEKSNLGTSNMPIVDGDKSTLSDFVDTQSDDGDRKSSSLKRQSSSDTTKVSHEIAIQFSDEDQNIFKNIAQANNEKVPLELVKSNRLKDENANAAIESKSLVPSTEPHQVSENNSESDILEDVKVCDICGDAGREEALAICSRCSDGAEHIYCMLIMRAELPEGDWLCEECKFKEDSENKKMVPLERACKTSKDSRVDKNPQDFGNVNPKDLSKLDNKSSIVTSVNPKNLSKLDNKSSTATSITPNDLSKPDKKSSTATSVIPKNISKLDNKLSTATHAGNEFQNSISASNRFLDNLEATSISAKVLEMRSPSGMPSGTINSTVEKALSCESSLKSLGAVKVRPSKVSGANNPLFVGNAPTPSGLNSSDIQAQFRSPRDIVTKSSFNNLKPKNKSVTENVPPKTKLLKEPTKVDGKREGVPLISKSESFKGTGPSHLHIDSTVKNQNSNQTYDARILTQGKEKSVLERKKSFTSDHPRVSSSLVPPTRTSCSKREPKAASHDRNLCVLSEANIVVANKGPEDAHGSVALHKMKQQTSHSEKNCHPNEAFTSEDQKQCRRNKSSCSTDKICDRVTLPGLSQSCKLTSYDMKNKSISLGNPRQAISAGKIVKCHRCNETGHATQSCSIDKLRFTALKPMGNRNMVIKPNRRKGIIEASISKGRIHNRSDQTERSSLSSASLRRTIPVKDTMLDVSSHSRNLTPLVGTSSVQEIFGKSTSNVSMNAVQNEDKLKYVQPMKVASSPRSNSIISSDVLKSEPPVQVLTKKAFMNFSPSTILAVPKKQWIWQGCFEIHRSGNFCQLCDGVQAHISSFASPKVLEVASSFPCNIQLEEVSCSIARPLQFQQKSFTDENIALFFYAVDSESHQKYYTKLVDNMLKNDLFLKGKLDGFELLIFPSNKLPEKSQCWNGFYYLWGVFKRKSVNYSERMPDFQKLHTPTCDAEDTTGHDFPSLVLVDSSVTLNVNSIQRRAEESSTSDRQVKLDEESKSTRSMNLDKLPSCGTKKKWFGYDLNEKFQDDDGLLDEEVLDNPSPLKKQRTCSFSDSKLIVEPVGCDADRSHSSDLKDCTISLESMQHSQENQGKFPRNVQASGVANSSSENRVPFLKTFAAKSTHNLLGYEKGKTKAIVPFIDLESVPVEDQPQENVAHKEAVHWDARHGMMHNFLHPQLPGSQASSDSLMKEATPWKRIESLSLDQSQRVLNKKMKPYNEMENKHNETTNYASSESYFSPISWGALTEPQLGNNVPLPVVVPLDRDLSHSNNVPNLDPALSAKKSSPLVPSLAGNDHSDHALPPHSSADEDDVSPALSLSLALPSPEGDNLTKTEQQTEQQVLPEKRTSFILFGKIIDARKR